MKIFFPDFFRRKQMTAFYKKIEKIENQIEKIENQIEKIENRIKHK